MRIKNIGTNQTQIETSCGNLLLISYETPVAAIIQTPEGLVAYKTEKNWSRTTSKHINNFLAGLEAQIKPQEWFDNLIK